MAEGVEELVDAVLEVAPPRGRPQGGGHEGGRQHLVEPADGLAGAAGQVNEVLARLGGDSGQRDGLPEGDERARPVAHREVHHLGHFRREEPLAPLDPLAGQRLVLEHEVVGDSDGHDHDVGAPGLQDRLQQSRLQGLELAAVAASALRVEEQVVPVHELGHVRPQRGEVGGVAGVPANRDGAGHVAVQQPHGPVEQVDAGGDDGGPDAVVVEHHELDEVVHVALVVRGVDDAVRSGRGLGPLDVLGARLYLAQDRVQGVLQGAIHLVPLGRPELLEVGGNPLLRLVGTQPGAAAEVPRHLLPRQHGLGNLVVHCGNYNTGRAAGQVGRRPARRVGRGPGGAGGDDGPAIAAP